MENILETTGSVLDNNVREIEPIAKSHSLKLTLEKLQGGFISDITGKRAIYRDADDILDSLNMNRVINKLEHAEYRLHIDIIHKDDHADLLDLSELKSIGKQEELTLQDAKDCGIIEKETFNPNVPSDIVDTEAPIKVTLANAYSIARLKAIDWKKWNEELPLQPSEISKITKMNTTTLYASWKKVKEGNFSYQHSTARIGFTVLAMYYERALGIRTSAKDQCQKMKDDMLKVIREIELMGNGKAFIKTSDVTTKLVAMRTTLL